MRCPAGAIGALVLLVVSGCPPQAVEPPGDGPPGPGGQPEVGGGGGAVEPGGPADATEFPAGLEDYFAD